MGFQHIISQVRNVHKKGGSGSPLQLRFTRSSVVFFGKIRGSSLELTASWPLKMNAWKTVVLLRGFGLYFSVLFVLGRVRYICIPHPNDHPKAIFDLTLNSATPWVDRELYFWISWIPLVLHFFTMGSMCISYRLRISSIGTFLFMYTMDHIYII